MLAIEFWWWINLKSNVKIRSVEYKKSCRKTAGGRNENERTDEWKDQISNIIGETPISGHSNTDEPYKVNFRVTIYKLWRLSGGYKSWKA